MSSASEGIRIAPRAVVCVESKLKGTINIGCMTIIHPSASIIAVAGPVTIKEGNIIEEKAAIIHKREGASIKSNPVPLNIGASNSFEVGCEIRAKSIGDHNVFEAKCFVGPDVVIGNGCVIGAGCQLRTAETLPDGTIIRGQDCARSMFPNKPPHVTTPLLQELTSQQEVLERILPNYHLLRKPNN